MKRALSIELVRPIGSYNSTQLTAFIWHVLLFFVFYCFPCLAFFSSFIILYVLLISVLNDRQISVDNRILDIWLSVDRIGNASLNVFEINIELATTDDVNG